MIPMEATFEAKLRREARLGWQSHTLLLLVALPSAVGLFFLTVRAPTAASLEGLAICAAFGVLVWLLRAATPLAALTGFVLTACLYLGTVQQPSGSWRRTALLPGLALFVLAFAATRFRRAQKERSGLAESRRGRGASQIAANMGAAAIAALALPPWLWMPSGPPGHSFIGAMRYAPLVAALAEAAADTVSSEVGQALGGSPILVTSMKHVPAGTDGAISVAGTFSGLLAAAVVVLVAVPTLRLNPQESAIAWCAALCGLFADSCLGATLERQGWLNNDLVNFISTALAALIAAFLAVVWDYCISR